MSVAVPWPRRYLLLNQLGEVKASACSPPASGPALMGCSRPRRLEPSVSGMAHRCRTSYRHTSQAQTYLAPRVSSRWSTATFQRCWRTRGFHPSVSAFWASSIRRDEARRLTTRLDRISPLLSVVMSDYAIALFTTWTPQMTLTERLKSTRRIPLPSVSPEERAKAVPERFAPDLPSRSVPECWSFTSLICFLSEISNVNLRSTPDGRRPPPTSAEGNALGTSAPIPLALKGQPSAFQSLFM